MCLSSNNKNNKSSLFPKKKKKIPNSYHKKLSSLVLNDILSLIQ